MVKQRKNRRTNLGSQSVVSAQHGSLDTVLPGPKTEYWPRVELGTMYRSKRGGEVSIFKHLLCKTPC